MNKVLELLVKKGISQDEDSAKRVLYKYIERRGKTLNHDDFNQLFTKCIFKDALINMAETLTSQNAGGEDLPLTLMIGKYQRQLMMNGLEEDQETKA